jgi:hypothetical protein
MANEELKGDVIKEGEDKGGCCGSGKSRCCCCKALAVIGLLAIGGIGGFFAGRHCQRVCDMKTPAAVTAPAAPAPAPQK